MMKITIVILMSRMSTKAIKINITHFVKAEKLFFKKKKEKKKKNLFTF